MNSKVFNSVRTMFDAFYANPEFSKEANIQQLFGAMQLIGESKTLDMIEEAEPKQVIKVENYQSYADELYKKKLRVAFEYVLDSTVSSEKLTLDEGSRIEEALPLERCNMCLRCFWV